MPDPILRHIEIDTRNLVAGGVTIIDGHVFLAESVDIRSGGRIQPPHPSGTPDAFDIVTDVHLTLKHAWWRGCLAVEAPVAESTTGDTIEVLRAFSNMVQSTDRYPTKDLYGDDATIAALEHAIDCVRRCGGTDG